MELRSRPALASYHRSLREHKAADESLNYIALRLCSAPVHPLNARLTAAISSLMVTAPSPFVSKDGQASTDVVPSAMLTPLISSSTVTLPS